MARQLVPQPLRAPGLPGARTHCSDLLAMPWTMLFDAARQQRREPLDLPLWSGLRLHALAQLPAHARTVGDTHTAAVPGIASAPAPLREAEVAMIRRAVQEARGNVAEAARALGISRATVYRKLGAPKGG